MPAPAAPLPPTAPDPPEEPRRGDGTARVDVWLAGDRGISRSAAQQLVRAGRVLLNGSPARAGQRVQARDEVTVLAVPGGDVPAPAGPAVDLRIVYEDEWLAVVDKPAGLVVHPAPGHPHGTLADGLRQRGDTWSLLGGHERPGIVHRLDRYTSGLLVVARTEAAHRALAAQLAERTLGRTYWVLVRGSMAEATATVDAPIGRDPHDRKRMAVVSGGRPAVTELRVLERCPHTTVLQAALHTGRTHQIRVHCAFIGRPVVGDPVYGSRDDPERGRPALHARALRLVHPGDGTVREFESPLPDDLVALLERARRGEV